MGKERLALLLISLLVNSALVACVHLFSSEFGAEFKCMDAIGCVDIPLGEPIHIAYALTISGPDQSIGIDSLNGIEIAMEDKGQILGHEILLTGEDEGCTPEGGRIASTKIAADLEIIAVIGPSCSDAARTGVPVLSQAGLTIVSPSNTDFDLTETGNENQYPGYARTAHNDIHQGGAAAEFAFQVLGARKAATIHDGSPTSDKLQEVFAENFIQLGGNITSQKTINPDVTDFRSLLSLIAGGKPDLIYYPLPVQTGSLITRQAKEVSGLGTTKLLAAEKMFTLELVETSGQTIEGLYVSSQDYTELSDLYKSDFLPKYLARFGTEPINNYHAQAYDAFMLIANTIEKVAVIGKNGVLHIPRHGLRQALYNTKDYHGLTGNLSCTATGDCAQAHIAIYQYHPGEFPPEKTWP